MFAIMKERSVKRGKGEAASLNLTKLFHIVMVTRFYESDPSWHCHLCLVALKLSALH